jgi:hypothetical protein
MVVVAVIMTANHRQITAMAVTAVMLAKVETAKIRLNKLMRPAKTFTTCSPPSGQGYKQ